MPVKFTNNASTTVATAINNSVTTLVVASASDFPDISGANDYCWLTIESGTNREIVKATNLSSNTFTIVRAQDGTSAQSWAQDSKVELRLTSALLQDVIDGLGAGMMMDTDIFTGDGSDTTFNLSRQPDNENNLLVFVDGVFQAHNAYSVSGTTLTFSAAPANGRVITAYHMATTVGGSNLIKATMTGDNSDVTLDVGTRIVHENNVQVFFDGVYQSKGNYSVSGSVITFSTAPPTGVAVEAILNTATNISTASQLADADSDTLIQVEESSDEDTIRMDIAGTEVLTLTNSVMTLKGTTPSLIIGDAGAEDTKIVFDGNAQDYYIGLDDSADSLLIGRGATVGTTAAITVDSSSNASFSGLLTAAAKARITDVGNATVAGLQFTDAGCGISTPNADQMNFITADNTRMLIDSSGNIGIGGTGNARDELLHLEKSSGTTMVKTEVASNSVVGFNIKKTGSTTQEWKIVDGQTANGKLEIYDVTDSRSVMTFDGSGYVGIGHAAPDNAVHIQGSGFNAAHIKVERTDVGSSNDAALVLKAAAGANADYGLGGIWFQNALDTNAYALIRGRTDDSSGTSGRLEFVTATSAVGNGTTPSMVINSASNVEIKNDGQLVQTVASGGGDYHLVTHTGNEAWSWGARSGSGSDDYLDVGISGGTRAMSWHENGRVGMGNTSPSYDLDVGISGEIQARFKSTGDTGYTQGAILLESSDSASSPEDRGQGVYMFNHGTDRTWYMGTTYADADTFQIGVGDGTTLQKITASSSKRMVAIDTAKLAVSGMIRFSATGADANRYTVYWNSSTGDLIVVSSDRRLKKDFDYDLSGIETIKKLKPVRFTWKESEKRQLGFIAQEAITADEHLAWNDTENDQWGLNGWEGYAAMLTKAVQEQQTLIEELQAEVKALKEA